MAIKLKTTKERPAGDLTIVGAKPPRIPVWPWVLAGVLGTVAAIAVLFLLSPPLQIWARRLLYRGEVEIGSRPQGAQLTLDGVPKGRTPVFIKSLPPGEHTVVLCLPGLDTVTASLVIAPTQAGDTSRGLRPVYSFRIPVDIRSWPDGAKVVWDTLTEPRGVTPMTLTADVGSEPTRFTLRHGDFRRIEPSGQLDFSGPDSTGSEFLTVRRTTADGRQRWQIEQRFYTDLSLSVTPTDASASLDGQPLTLTAGRAKRLLDYGSHSLTVSRRGYETRRTTLTVQTGAPLTPEVRLRCPVTFCVFGFTSAAGNELDSATVQVDDQSPIAAWTRAYLLPGDHDVVSSAPGYRDVSYVLTVEPGREADTVTLVPADMVTKAYVYWRNYDNPDLQEPASNVLVWADRQSDGESFYLGTTSRTGYLETRTLGPGDYTFSVQPFEGERERDQVVRRLTWPSTTVKLLCDKPRE
jgi:hypothetical protein